MAILLPVLGKSAQFPFMYWLPKAMEGPTPSSAIFYGSLSVHAGVFLLIRTYSIWQNTAYFWILVCVIGAITTIFASMFGRVQSNIKGQIGYASIAQVGVMLVELSLGFPKVALAHLVFNAVLRSFQLLVSPSIIADQLHIHHALDGRNISWNFRWLQSPTLYVFALNEGYFEMAILSLTAPFKKILEPLKNRNPLWTLNTVFAMNLCVMLCLWPDHDYSYLFGLTTSWLLALEVLSRALDYKSLNFANFPLTSAVMFIGFLGVIGFPISTTFSGEEHISELAYDHGLGHLVGFLVSYVLSGILLIQLYSQLFLGKREEDLDTSQDLSSKQAFTRLALFAVANLVYLRFTLPS